MRTSEGPKERGRAFTMIELMIVTAVIAILTALLLPALQKAKEKSKAADCANNLRQVGLAFAMHADDNDDYFPFTVYWWRTLGADGYLGKGEMHGYHTTTWWAETRWPSFRCLAEKGTVFNTADPNCRQPNPVTTAYDSDLDHCSYAINWAIDGYNYYVGYGCTAKPRRGYSITNPKNTIYNGVQVISQYGGRGNSPIVMDKSIPQWGWVINYAEWNVDTQWGLDNAGWDYAFRHPGGRANVLYLDGHVGSVQHYFVSGKPNYVEIWNVAYSPADPFPCGVSDCPPCP